MGLIQSTAAAPISPEPQKTTEVVTEQTKTTNTQTTTEQVDEKKEENVKESEVKPVEVPATPNSTPILKPIEEEKAVEVLERYVEPTGTKVEVAPVDVATAGDVVKKNKKKNKNKHRS